MDGAHVRWGQWAYVSESRHLCVSGSGPMSQSRDTHALVAVDPSLRSETLAEVRHWASGLHGGDLGPVAFRTDLTPKRCYC
jgi:hypothetical protein